ncbi:TonB-dependent receptor [Flexithrix dorotheae]|uniref:TonB-dependent receptor n=1 Tax=Flexithrix dorotheae TaxID=70993 RepID=UPI000371E19E|nr:TonB-dependent receptor [Flexithrix dorotheae]
MSVDLKRITLVFALLILIIKFGYSQNEILQKPVNNFKGSLSIGEVMNKLERDCGVQFSYSSQILDTSKKVTLNKTYYRLQEILDILFPPNAIKYTVQGNYIILTPARPKQEQPKTFVVNGIISDAHSGETLIGASVYLLEKNEGKVKFGITTNPYGFYSISLPEGRNQIVFSYIGYLNDTIEVNLTNDIQIDKELKIHVAELQEIVVSSKEESKNVSSPETSVYQIDKKTLGQIPFIYGEEDVLKALKTLPGINSMGEGTPGINVRGGNIDQSILLLDEAPIFNSAHLYGLVSIFNPDVVKDVKINKGSLPASKGGFLSSVSEVRQKEGNNKELLISGGIGAISGRLTIEAPIIKDKSSFLISGRQSFPRLSSFTLKNTAFSSGYNTFSEINTKFNYQLNDNNQFFLSGYFGEDNVEAFNEQVYWGNNLGSFRWNHLFKDKRLFSNFSAIFSNYEYSLDRFQSNELSLIQASIQNYNIKSNFSFFKSSVTKMDFGIDLIFRRINPGQVISVEGASSGYNVKLDREKGLEGALYFEKEDILSPKFTIQYGMRYSFFALTGPGKVYQYMEDLPKTQQTTTGVKSFNKFELKDFYNALEPRLAIKYSLSEESSLKFNYNKTNQYIHLLSNTNTPLLTDLWKLSGPYLKPQVSNQISLGYYKNINMFNFESSVEVFYKKMNNLLDFKDGASLLLNPQVETEILQGEGRAYGIEFFAKKNLGKISGWLSYTLSRSEKKYDSKFEEETINEGNYFPTNFDALHSLRIVGFYQISKRLDVSASFNFDSGRPYSVPYTKFDYNGIVIPNYKYRNQERLPANHRVDLSGTYLGGTIKKKGKNKGKPKRLHSSFTVSIYNLYSRQNVFSVFYEVDNQNPNKLTPQKISFFDAAIFSFTWNFKYRKRK